MGEGVTDRRIKKAAKRGGGRPEHWGGCGNGSQLSTVQVEGGSSTQRPVAGGLRKSLL